MKDIDEIGNIDLHAEVSFDDELDLASVYYYRGETLVGKEEFSYTEFEKIFQ